MTIFVCAGDESTTWDGYWKSLRSAGDIFDTREFGSIESEVFRMLMEILVPINSLYPAKVGGQPSFIFTTSIGIVVNGAPLGDVPARTMKKTEDIFNKTFKVSDFGVYIKHM